MELKDIKYLNQRIYELDTEISRNAKMMFISTLIFCSLEKDFWNIQKLTTLVNFNISKSPIDDLIKLAKDNINKIKIIDKTKEAVFTSLTIISGVNTKLNNDRVKLQQFVTSFITDYLPVLKDDKILFLETLYMEVDKKAKGSNEGITLTPDFAAQLMVDLAELDYKKDVVADLASGTGLFSLLSYSVMLNALNDDLKDKKITESEHQKYNERLYNSIIANDFDSKMVTLCLANFLIKNLNTEFIQHENIFDMQKSTFKYKDKNGNDLNINPTKGILNPPYENNYKPVEILLKMIELIKDNQSKDEKVVVIIPPQKFGQKKETFKKILDYATLQSVVKMQDDLFTDSGQTPSTCIFVFNLDREHKETDIVHYYDFTNSGYIYLKDSGMVDKNKRHEILKKELLEKIKNTKQVVYVSSFVRDWSNFFEVNKELEITSKIKPNLIASSKEEADITLENITIKKMLKEKQDLINAVNNEYKDKDHKLEDYIIDILSEEI
ncbi:MAG: hypothetical protein RBR50_04005 [Candidatus Izemoplasmatales bacterium]|nr:hypothetical protein [Candidatus Izemoplasmatales bacterium]